ncbi:MAG: TonB-dependent receptor [Sphingomonadales bacterium]|nr:TonB-dependent receptor [Sphingomonadales bacterium]MDE2167901.1 TonB-dependent receptor [Sphingomonadales bacterium]
MTIRFTMLKSGLLLSCAGLALTGLQAHAADAPTAPAAPATDAPAPQGDIVVTATRRSESIQSVPMTLQALSGGTLSQLNVSNFNDLLKYTPNVTFSSNGPGQGAIFMRGLSTGFAGNQSSGTIAPFPNVALYLDDQSMQFPARNADVYVADIERVEVLEGPQGTLFGGGAEAGAVRYITAKPKLDKWEGHVEGSFGGTAGGSTNGSIQGMINIPVIKDKLAVRAVLYRDHQGGYIDNVASNFTRRATDSGSVAYNFNPTTANQSNGGLYSNKSLARNDFNPVEYAGGRVEALWDIAPDWNLLVAESYQNLEARGSSASYPTGSDFQQLGALQTTIFVPEWNSDKYWNTAWTLNGKIGGWKVVYTGAYMTRHISEQQDYSNYSRTGGGMYYQCTGSATGWGTGPTNCYSPVAYWNDTLRNTHHSEELRFQSPEDKRFRVIAGAYWEKFAIQDVMRFDYKTIPSCTTSGPVCSGSVQTFPGSTANQPGVQPANTAFGEDTQRGYDQLAFFGSADFDILPNLTLTGGTRYYRYKEYEVGSQFETYVGNCLNVPVCAVAGSGNVNIDAANDHVTYHGFKSKAELVWKPRDRTMVYALFSQGFRPGGFNRATKLILPDQNGTAQLNRPNGYSPDSLTNWEIGLKTDLLNHKVQFNLSAYYMVWNNAIINFFNPAGGFGNTSFATNGPSYHIKGAEVQIVARPFDGLTVQAGGTYNDSKQSSSPCLVSNVQASVNYGQCITTYYPGGVAKTVQSPFGSIGSTTPYSPKVQGNIRARYEWAQGTHMNWFVGGGVSYNGPMWNQPSTYPSGDGVTVPGTTLLRYHMVGYALLDAQVGFKCDNWTVSLFGDNLTNNHASTFTSSAQFIKAEVPLRPATYGIKASIDF